MTADKVDVGCTDAGGVEEGHDAGDPGAPVAALGDVVGVADFEHQFVAGFGVLGEREAAFGDWRGETEVRVGGSYDVEGGGGGGCKERENFADFVKGTGPYGGEGVREFVSWGV